MKLWRNKIFCFTETGSVSAKITKSFKGKYLFLYRLYTFDYIEFVPQFIWVIETLAFEPSIVLYAVVCQKYKYLGSTGRLRLPQVKKYL